MATGPDSEGSEPRPGSDGPPVPHCVEGARRCGSRADGRACRYTVDPQWWPRQASPCGCVSITGSGRRQGWLVSRVVGGEHDCS